MNEIWTKKWKKVLIWISGYVNFIAFAIVGGWVIVKSDDKELKRTAKTTFIVTLIFIAIEAVLLILSSIFQQTSGYYSSNLYDVMSILSLIETIAKIIVYAIFIIFTFCEDKTSDKIIKEFKKSDEDKDSIKDQENEIDSNVDIDNNIDN